MYANLIRVYVFEIKALKIGNSSSLSYVLNQDIRNSAKHSLRAAPWVIRHDLPTPNAICVFGSTACLPFWLRLAPTFRHVDPKNESPFACCARWEGHILGTDDLGRDDATRLFLYGQVSMAICFSARIITFGIGMGPLVWPLAILRHR